MPSALTLANYRRPLERVKQLSTTEKKQLTKLLKQEGTTVAAAAKDEEMSMELVDLVDGKGKAKYQLYLWPFGSGALLAAGTTTVVATVAQHGFEMEPEDGELRKAMAAAWKTGAKKLNIQETIEFRAPKKTPGAAQASGSILEQLAEYAQSGANLRTNDRIDIAKALYAIRERIFPTVTDTWRPYPKLRPALLTTEQRALLATIHKLNGRASLKEIGLFDSNELNARAIGAAPQGPTDVEITVGSERLPLWCAVSDVASGHMDHDQVLAAFRTLPPTEALAAWTELATGEGYNSVTYLASTNMRESNAGDNSPYKQKHRTRYYSWLADACVALGAAGRTAAEHVLDKLLPYAWGEPQTLAMLALTRHGGFDTQYDTLIQRLRDGESGRTGYAKETVDEIIAGLPAERRAALPPPPEPKKAIKKKR